MGNTIKMDDLGGNTPIFGNIHMYHMFKSYQDPPMGGV